MSEFRDHSHKAVLWEVLWYFDSWNWVPVSISPSWLAETKSSLQTDQSGATELRLFSDLSFIILGPACIGQSGHWSKFHPIRCPRPDSLAIKRTRSYTHTSMLTLDMVFEKYLSGKSLTTQVTDVGFLSSMNLHMVFQITILCKSLTTHLPVKIKCGLFLVYFKPEVQRTAYKHRNSLTSVYTREVISLSFQVERTLEGGQYCRGKFPSPVSN
jgi:hypothetical protein